MCVCSPLSVSIIVVVDLYSLLYPTAICAEVFKLCMMDCIVRCHVVMFILPEVHLPVPEILVIVSSGCPLKKGGCIKAGFNCSLVTCPRKRSLRLNMSSKQRWLFLIRGN